MARIRGGTNTSDVSRVQGLAKIQKDFLELFPALVLHGFLYLLPTWVSPIAGALLFLDLVIVVLWAMGEGVRFGLVRYRAE